MTLSDIQRKAVEDLCEELSGSYTRTESERNFQKVAIADIAEQHSLDKKMLRKVAKIYHKSQFSTVQEEHTELESMYKTVFGADNE